MKMANSDEELAFRQKEKEKLGNNLIVLFPLGSCVFVNVRASAHCNAKVLKSTCCVPCWCSGFCVLRIFFFRWAQMGGEFQELGVEKISYHTGRINPLVYWVDINMRLKLYVSLAMAIHQRWLDPETKAKRRHPENKEFCSPLVHSELEKRWLPVHDFWSIDFFVLQKLVEQPFCKLARALCSRFLASINASFAKDSELCSKSEKAIPAHGW